MAHFFALVQNSERWNPVHLPQTGLPVLDFSFRISSMVGLSVPLVCGFDVALRLSSYLSISSFHFPTC